MLQTVIFYLILLLVGYLVVLASGGIERKRLAAFNERFPPISDDEFLAQCPSGTSREVALKVRRIVADQLGVEYERIYPSSSFVNDLDAG
jgi:hypothetical protein